MAISSKGKPDVRAWWLLLLLAAVYVAINLGISRLRLNSLITSYLLQPALWGLVILTVVKLSPYKIAGKLKTRSVIIQIALAAGFLQVICLCIGGFFSGFGNSPSSFTPLSIAGNLVLVGSVLIGSEFSRAWLVNNSGRHTFLALAFVTLFFTVLSLSFSQITGIKADVSSLSFIISSLLPALAESLLASLLVLLAGPKASICYRGFLQAFWWFCPILPDLNWSLKGLIGVIVPILALVIIWNYYIAQTGKKVRKKSGGGLQAGWILTAVFCVAMIWFAVGIFPIHPVMIATGSMRPVIEPGDVEIIAKSPAGKIVVGDIIEYRKSEDMNIVHRVIAIKEDAGKKTFITKGDANNAPDSEPVLGENIVGKVVFGVPKIGWLASGVKSLFNLN